MSRRHMRPYSIYYHLGLRKVVQSSLWWRCVLLLHEAQERAYSLIAYILTTKEATGGGELPPKRGLEELHAFAATIAKLSLPYMQTTCPTAERGCHGYCICSCGGASAREWGCTVEASGRKFTLFKVEKKGGEGRKRKWGTWWMGRACAISCEGSR